MWPIVHSDPEEKLWRRAMVDGGHNRPHRRQLLGQARHVTDCRRCQLYSLQMIQARIGPLSADVFRPGAVEFHHAAAPAVAAEAPPPESLPVHGFKLWKERFLGWVRSRFSAAAAGL